MKKLFAKLPQLDKRIWLLIADALLLPGGFACWWLSGVMLSYESVCSMVALGGKCITCGGTHFVQALLGGDIVGALHHNVFLFAAVVYLLIGYLLLHAAWLGNWSFAQTVLKRMFSIPALIVWGALLVVFAVWRAAPAVATVTRFLSRLIPYLISRWT